jgi:uncharacterized membrane protein
MHARQAVTIGAPLQAVRQAWTDLERLPAFLPGVHAVTANGTGRMRWTAEGADGEAAEWDVTTVDEGDDVLHWRCTGSGEDGGGTDLFVRFVEAPGGRGTEVHLDVSDGEAFRPSPLAKLFGDDPAQQAAEDLRRFKQLMETGEIARSEAAPSGAKAAAARHQRPAQHMTEAEAMATRQAAQEAAQQASQRSARAS